MAYRLGEYVVYGELRNIHSYSTHGMLVLRSAIPDEETVLHFELTGNPGRDMQGKHLRFWPAEDIEDEEECPVFDPDDHTGLQHRQIGPTGTMTAQGWVRTLPCGVREFMRRAELGEPLPTPWKRRVYLEWYSQNGRVVIELPGACVEACIRPPREGDDEDDGDWEEVMNLALPPGLDPDAEATGPEITLVQREDDGSLFTYRVEKRGDDGDDGDYEMELMDACMEEGDGEALTAIIPDINTLPAPDTLDDVAVEAALKDLLARLAIFGIALDVCEHYSPRDAYRLLRGELLAETRIYPELAGTGWVQHMMTSEFCPACDAEADRDFERMNEGLPPA